MLVLFNWVKQKFAKLKKNQHCEPNIDKIAKMNWELDTNSNLREGFRVLTEQYSSLTESEYIEKTLNLLHQEGLSLTGDELKKLLLLRRQTDKMLQAEKKEQEMLKKAKEKL